VTAYTHGGTSDICSLAPSTWSLLALLFYTTCFSPSPSLLPPQRVARTHTQTHTVYRCSNCHVATVPCSTCQHATRFKTRTSERLGGFGGTGGKYGADAVGGRSGGGGVGVKGAGEERGEETKVTNLKQCLACSSGKEWSELERNHREQGATGVSVKLSQTASFSFRDALNKSLDCNLRCILLTFEISSTLRSYATVCVSVCVGWCKRTRTCEI